MSIRDIQIIVLDVDGTMTDGGVYYDNNGIETKKFNIKDGAGIRMAENVGIEFMILTGRESQCVLSRARDLDIKYVFQGVKNKKEFLQEFEKTNCIEKQKIAYIGDDLNDLAAMSVAGTTACPSDACDDVKEYVDYCLRTRGGFGAVREFIEIMLREKGIYRQARETMSK